MAGAEDAGRGHAVRAHTADVRIEAWAPTAGACYEELVAAFVELFAGVDGTRGAADAAGERRTFDVGSGSPAGLAVLLLEDVLGLVDVEGLVPAETEVERCDGGRLTGVFRLVPIDAVELTGAVAKGISYEGLVFEPVGRDGPWHAEAIVDV